MHQVLRTVIAGLALAALLVGCDQKPSGTAVAPGGAPSGAHRAVVGVSLLTLANPFFVEMADAMKAQGEASGIEVVVVSGELDAAKQAGQVDDFLTRKVDAIILCPVDSKAIGSAVKKAEAAGTPVFTADIAVLDPSAKVVSHVATDNFLGGKLAGEAMIKLLGGSGKVAVIDHPEVESVILRTRGFEAAIAGTGIEIVARLPGKGARDESFKAAEAILQSHPEITGLFAINDPSALGAVAALEKAGAAGRISVIGFDGQPEAVEAVKAGRIKADVLQHPRQIGKRIIELVALYREGKDVPAQELIPPTVITPDSK